MVGYCKTTRCLRSYLLDYFGEHHTGGCGNCSNCTGEFVQTDITTEAQKILSGVARIQKRWPGGLGVVALVQMLRGAKDQKTLERGLDQFPDLWHHAGCAAPAHAPLPGCIAGAGLPG